MSLSHSPTSSSGNKNIFSRLFGKVKGAIIALGILSAPIEQAGAASENHGPCLEERLMFAKKMNLEGMKSYQELENVIEFTWSQLKDTPKAPKVIRDKYGHITTEGLTWIESDFPKEHISLLNKYRDTQKKLEKMKKDDPNWGVLEYSLICLGGFLLALMGYSLGKVPKKEVEKLKREYEEVLTIATNNAVRNAVLEVKNTTLKAKIAEMEQSQGKGPEGTEIVDAEIIDSEEENDASPIGSRESIPQNELPKWMRETFLTGEYFESIRTFIIEDTTSDSPSLEAEKLKESIQKLSDTTATERQKATHLNTMSENLIDYARYRQILGKDLTDLLHKLSGAYRDKALSFYRPVLDQSFDNTKMIRVGKSTLSLLKISEIFSLPVMKDGICLIKGKVSCK